MRRVLVCGVAALLLIGVLFFGPAASTAEAQATCPDGELVAGQCEIVGQPPVRRAGTCPRGPNIVQAGCYRVAAPGPSGQCEQGFWQIGDECRQSVRLIPGGLVCPDAGFVVVGDRCIGTVSPTCGPLGCNGKVTLAYTIECVGEGLARVQLAEPDLTNGATISLITVNGSATIGANLTGGSAVSVVVTPNRQNDTVTVTGPTTAPACATDPSPAPPPPPATPTSIPVAPAPTAAPAVQANPTPTQPPAPSATGTPIPDPVVGTISNYGLGDCDNEARRSLRLTTSVEPSTAADAVQLLVDGEVVVERSSAGEHTLAIDADGQTHVVELVVVAPSESAGDMLVLDFPLCLAEAAPVQSSPTATAVPACLAGELFTDGRCVPRCSEFQTPDVDDCYALQRAEAATQVAAVETAAPVASSDNDEVPLVPLAAIGGATVVLAAAAYAALSRPRTPRA